MGSFQRLIVEQFKRVNLTMKLLICNRKLCIETCKPKTHGRTDALSIPHVYSFIEIIFCLATMLQRETKKSAKHREKTP